MPESVTGRFYMMPSTDTGGPVLEITMVDGQPTDVRVAAQMRADPYDHVARAIVKRFMR